MGGTSGEDDASSDANELLRMGYRQELRRSINFFMSFSYSFTVCAVVPGIAQLYTYGLTTGGPAVMGTRRMGAQRGTLACRTAAG